MSRWKFTVAILGSLIAVSSLPAAVAAEPTATATGVTWSWGLNREGQLGDGTRLDRPGPQTIGVPDAVAVAAGLEFSLALRRDGTVWAWGDNEFGQLGDGSTVLRTTPVKVRGLTSITAISAGAQYGLALRRDGTVWTWGDDSFGQLGDGGPVEDFDAHSTVPVRVRDLTGVRQVIAGSFRGMALRTDGSVYSWGSNYWGELGDGTKAARSVAKRVGGLTGIRSVGAGFSYSLAARSNGSVAAWGRNTDGQMGQGTYHYSDYRARPVTVPGLAGVTAVTAGSETAYALNENGTVAAWGRNDVGQVGDGTAGNSRARPTPVRTYRGPLTGIRSLAAGTGDHAFAIRTDGIAVGWGWNYAGALGIGSYSPEVVVYARPLANLKRVVALAAGGRHGLAVTR